MTIIIPNGVGSRFAELHLKRHTNLSAIVKIEEPFQDGVRGTNPVDRMTLQAFCQWAFDTRVFPLNGTVTAREVMEFSEVTSYDVNSYI